MAKGKPKAAKPKAKHKAAKRGDAMAAAAKPKAKSTKVKPAKVKPVEAASGKAAGTKPKRRALPVPAALPDASAARAPKRVRRAESRHLVPFDATLGGAGADILDRLWDTVEERRLAGDTVHSHSARLIARGTAKVAQKLGEEAVECLIEATLGNRDATVAESADVLYHLLVVLRGAGIPLGDVLAELERRTAQSGLAEKAARGAGTGS